MRSCAVLLVLFCAQVGAACPQWPLVIAHRGASGSYPEHTEIAYWQAMQQGADFIEADLVVTKDGVLISRHENELSQSTNVAALPQFSSRKTTKRIDGIDVTGWFSEDFTLAEIRELKARESKPEIRAANTRYNDQFGILTLAEVMQLVERYQQISGRIIGLYIETKHPSYFKVEGTYLDGKPIATDISKLLLQQLSQWQRQASNPVFIQSFEMSNLWWMKQHGLAQYQVRANLIQLIGDISGSALYPASNFAEPWDLIGGHNSDMIKIAAFLQKPGFHYGDLISPAGLDFLASYVDGIGPWKEQWYQGDRPLIAFAKTKQLNLQIHPYTFRAESTYVPAHFSDFSAELKRRYQQGVNAVFTDNTAEAVSVRQAICSG